jgi:hypothetical protein
MGTPVMAMAKVERSIFWRRAAGGLGEAGAGRPQVYPLSRCPSSSLAGPDRSQTVDAQDYSADAAKPTRQTQSV